MFPTYETLASFQAQTKQPSENENMVYGEYFE